MPGALDGVHVVDFGHYFAGPLLAALLAQNGAEVVHVDAPGGPRPAGLPDSFLNRGKQRITLDLTQDRDRRIGLDLVRAADVVVENFRPGVMTRLGLGPDDTAAANPRVIYCSLPGFAADDPRAPIAAWEGVVMSATAGYRRLHEHWDWKARAHADVPDAGRPLFTGIPIASNTAALLGALAVVTALVHRDRTGTGTRLEIPLAEAMLEVVGFHLELPDFVGRRDDLPRPFLGSYRSADGRFVDQVPYPRFVEKFLLAAGVWEEWRAAGLADLPRVFADPELKLRADERFTRLIGTRSAAEWEDIAIELGIPFAQVRTPAEWLAHEQARASGAVADVEDPEYGPVRMAGAALHLSRTPSRITTRSLPDDDRQAILSRLRGLAPTAPPATTARVSDEPPLAGVSVVELSQVVAGPIAGRLLADYGADVIKVANPAPTGNNGFHGSYTNRGKRSVFLDVQDSDDRRLLWSAVQSADVLLQNYAYGAVERYGFGFENLHAMRPDLVYVSLGAFPRSGPWRGRRGHENQAVAATGLSARYGGVGAWPSYQPYLVCDVGAGIMGALAAALGIYHRNRSGQGQHISSSLSQVATLHQGLYLFSGPDHARMPEPTGPGAHGWSALQRLYQAADGWLFLAATTDQLDSLRQATGLPADGTELMNLAADGSLATALAGRLRTRTREHWVHDLGTAGITAQPVRELADVAHDPTWHRRGILRYGRNGEGQDDAPILGTGPQPWPAPGRALRHPGPLGAHTTSLRAELSPTSADQEQRSA